jgi:hypothetical protein
VTAKASVACSVARRVRTLSPAIRISGNDRNRLVGEADIAMFGTALCGSLCRYQTVSRCTVADDRAGNVGPPLILPQPIRGGGIARAGSARGGTARAGSARAHDLTATAPRRHRRRTNTAHTATAAGGAAPRLYTSQTSAMTAAAIRIETRSRGRTWFNSRPAIR